MGSKANPYVYRIWPPRKAVRNSSIKDVLKVESIDLCFDENGKSFNTQSYEMMVNPRPTKRPRQLVVRRGAPFTVRLLCSRKFDLQVDTMVLVFSIVPLGKDKATFGSGTESYVLVHPNPDEGISETGELPDDWRAILDDVKEKPLGKAELTLQIRTPSYAPVARWTVQFHCRLDTTDAKSMTEIKDPMYLLYNPWCAEDPVYMEDEASRKEYVLQDSTLICKPSKKGPYMTSWILGQYEANVLDCVLYLIAEVGNIRAALSGNPVLVTRALTGAINSASGYGLLRGNWSGNYEDGTPPTAWTGSAKILQQFYDTGKTVNYGQCWVFGGVLTTVCRAIGIPSRIITNFESAGDHDASLSIDYFVDDKDNAASGMTVDSIWNYHVWNEAWMKRKDLQNPHFDGWQVIDGTPQQLSDGMYKCGPFPVAAVKQGFVHVPFDGDFIYAEVNADVIYWSIGNDQNPPKPLEINTSQVGRDISTKAIGSSKRQDITASYKQPENTKEEREVMKTAMQFSCQRFASAGLAKRLLGHMVNDSNGHEQAIKLELKCDEELTIGSTFQFELIVTCTSAVSSVEASGNLVLKDSDYTGRHVETLKRVPFAVKLEPLESKSILVPLDFKDYSSTASNKTNIKGICTAQVKGSDRTYLKVENFHLTPPAIELTLIEHSLAGPIAVQVALRNPLPVPLTRGRFTVEGSRFTDPLEKKYDLIPVGGVVNFIYSINLTHKGKMVVTASFISNELKNVHGNLTVLLSGEDGEEGENAEEVDTIEEVEKTEEVEKPDKGDRDKVEEDNTE
ncbi:annulin-like [Anopheles stephensi]|uniref:annulin-like n=1 Tax=Anopheles stephensi TaxID=30069 RepID=UPI001658AD44|nr:annulin-like [Anopheles stephensi]